MPTVIEKNITTENDRTIHLVSLQNDKIKVDVIPEIGGKIVTLMSKQTGTNYLLDSDKKFVLPAFGDSFDLRYAYGFDECFPTVEACYYKAEHGIIELPDHGEVWSRSWNYQCKDGSIFLSVEGINLDYIIKKEIKLLDMSLVIHYLLKNRSHSSFKYIWSPHPLFSVRQGDEILLNEEIEEMMVSWSSNENLAQSDDRIDWPVKNLEPERIDWSIVQQRESDIAVKLFSDRLTMGRAAFYKKSIDESLIFRFDPGKIPFLGLWLCYGGWPLNRGVGSYTVALEPTIAQSDALPNAEKKNEASRIHAKATHQWELELCIMDGKASV